MTNSTLFESGLDSTWIGSVVGIISGTLLVGLGLVLAVVLCRKRQIRKERLLREHLYYTIGDRPPNPVAALAEENSNDQPITLTNYVNLPQVEPATTKPMDIPGTTRNIADTVTNSAYSGGVHYDRIPGEPDSKPASAASEHLYSVIKDEPSAKKKGVAQPAQKQKQQKKVSSELGSKKGGAEAERATTKGASTLLGAAAVVQPVDMEGEGFIELLPRNTQAYDSLKREGHQEIQELSIVLTSGAYDQLHSPEDEQSDKKDKQKYIFNPYDGDSDNESPTSQDDANLYDDTLGVKLQLSSLQAITNGQSTDSRDKNHDISASSGRLNKKPVSFVVDHSSDSEMTHAYDAIDELQKQIHILSQSIPTLDLYGYEDLDKVKPAPKPSRSIPILDVAGYEDLDAMKPAQKQATPRIQVNYTDLGLDNHFYESITEKKAGRHSLGAVVNESPPSVPTRTIESMYTAVQKKPKSSTIAAHAAIGGEGENKAKKLEAFYSTSKKSSSTTNLVEPQPPVPSLTVEAFYTAVQKPKKRTPVKSSATPAEGGPPPLPPKGETEESAPTVSPATIASMYTTVQKRPKGAKRDAEENAPTVPPTTIASMYTAVQKRPKETKKDVEESAPTVPPTTIASMYTAVQKRPKAKKATDTEVPTFEFEVVPPPLPPKTVEEAYLAAQKEGKIPPIPPRAHERVYSGVYRHKEEKQTVL